MRCLPCIYTVPGAGEALYYRVTIEEEVDLLILDHLLDGAWMKHSPHEFLKSAAQEM